MKNERPVPPAPPRLEDADREALLVLARTTLESELARGAPPAVPDSTSLGSPGACFVTLRTGRGGELRGCCGETRAQRSLAESVIAMTLASALEDPRFPPVVGEEIVRLSIEITVLGPLDPIRPDEVEIGRHGLMLVRGGRRGLLLPQVPVDHGWDRGTFLAAVCRKAGLRDDSWRDERCELLGFEALHWRE